MSKIWVRRLMAGTVKPGTSPRDRGPCRGPGCSRSVHRAAATPPRRSTGRPRPSPRRSENVALQTRSRMPRSRKRLRRRSSAHRRRVGDAGQQLEQVGGRGGDGRLGSAHLLRSVRWVDVEWWPPVPVVIRGRSRTVALAGRRLGHHQEHDADDQDRWAIPLRWASSRSRATSGGGRPGGVPAGAGVDGLFDQGCRALRGRCARRRSRESDVPSASRRLGRVGGLTSRRPRSGATPGDPGRSRQRVTSLLRTSSTFWARADPFFGFLPAIVRDARARRGRPDC